jgi:hypothetical protein
MEDNWEHLAAAVREAMAQRYDTKTALLSNADGLTNKPLDALLAGRAVSPKTLRRVERALGWPPRTADRILRGETLVAVSSDGSVTSETHAPPAEYYRLDEAGRAAVDEIIKRLAGAG